MGGIQEWSKAGYQPVVETLVVRLSKKKKEKERSDNDQGVCVGAPAAGDTLRQTEDDQATANRSQECAERIEVFESWLSTGGTGLGGKRGDTRERSHCTNEAH